MLDRLRRVHISQRTLQRPFEFGLAGVAALGIPRVLSDITNEQPLLVVAGLALIVASHVALVLQCLRRGRLTSPLTVGAALGIVLVVAGQVTQSGDNPALWRVDAWLGVTFAFLVLIHPRGRQLPTLGAVTLICFTTLALTGAMDWRSQLLSMLFTAAPLALLALAWLCVSAMIDEGIAHRHEREQHVRADGIAQEKLETAASIRRGTHDSLLHCLQLIGASWAPLTRTEMRAMCAQTLQKLSDAPSETMTPGESSLGQVLDTAVAGEPCHIAWDVEAGTVAPHVAKAMAGATREAVRNVVKHCARAEATIRVRTGADRCTVDISDDGPGFDVNADSRNRWGWVNSIAARMASVGGTAQVRSEPRGTTVSLVWPAPEEPLTSGPGHSVRAWLSWVPVPLVIASLANVTMTRAVLGPGITAVVWLALVSLVVVAALRVRTRGLTHAQAWLLCVIALASIVANDLWIDPQTTNGWDLWVPSLAGSLVILALPGRRIATALSMAALVLGGTVLASLLILGKHATLVTHYGAVMAVATHVMMTLVLAFGAASVASYIHRTRQLEATLHRQSRLAAEREEMVRLWLHRAREIAGDFLSEVASGHRDPTHPEVRREASWLDSRIRDELQLWPGDAEAAVVLDRMRREGWQCRLHLDAPDPATRRDVVRILAQLPVGVAGQSVVVSARDGVATLTFSNPALTDEQRMAIHPWIVREDSDFTQARTPASLPVTEPVSH